MFEYLVDREMDEMFRTSSRTLTFPDGTQERIETYRLVWAWWDRAMAYEFTYSEGEFLTMVQRCAADENRSLADALGRVLDYIVMTDEAEGLDYTDDNLELDAAKRATRRFHDRKDERKSG